MQVIMSDPVFVRAPYRGIRTYKSSWQIVTDTRSAMVDDIRTGAKTVALLVKRLLQKVEHSSATTQAAAE
jgi:hypothetical protein